MKPSSITLAQAIAKLGNPPTFKDGKNFIRVQSNSLILRDLSDYRFCSYGYGNIKGCTSLAKQSK